MYKIIITLLTVSLAVAGCRILPAAPEQVAPEPPEVADIPKFFFDRTIIYYISPEAKPYMNKLEVLVAHVVKAEEPLPDEKVLPIYRDTDIDRNHNITADEARNFYEDYVIRFEETLEPVKLR